MKFSVLFVAFAAAQPSKYNLCKRTNRNIVSGVDAIRSVKVISLGSCQKECKAESTCTDFSMNGAGGSPYTCDLKKTKTGVLPVYKYDTKYTSASVNCGLNPIDYNNPSECKRYDASMVGAKVIKKVGATTAVECQKACLATKGCKYFTVKSGTSCQLIADGVAADQDLTKNQDRHEWFPMELTDNKGAVTATATCNLAKLTLHDVIRGTDGLEHHVVKSELGEKTYVLDKASHIAGAQVKDFLHTHETLNDVAYQSEAPTSSPTAAPTGWWLNPKNAWVPAQKGQWLKWTGCTVSCGVGGIQKRQAVITASHMNPRYSGVMDKTVIGQAPRNKVCTKYATKFPYRCASYEYNTASMLPTTNDEQPPHYWVSSFQNCNTAPCPINCEWSRWSEWKTVGGGNVRRVRTVAIDAANKGLPCVGGKSQTKQWQDTKFTEKGERDFCVKGTSNGVWSKCAKTRSGQVLSTRVKTETICDHGEFYKLPRSAVKICTKKNTRLALTQAQMANGNLVFAEDIHQCQKIATSKGKTTFAFKAAITRGGNCMLGGRRVKPTSGNGWTMASTTCNLNAEYVRPGSNPSKIVMKYHQTKVCRGNRQIADYTRTMLRSDRAGLTEAP